MSHIALSPTNPGDVPILGSPHRWPMGSDGTAPRGNTTVPTVEAPTADQTLDLALRLCVAHGLAAEKGFDVVDQWKNVALVVMRLAREGRIPTGG